MSTFDGVITEIPDISVDYFKEENYFAKAFFLSHIHSDHTEGLFEEIFVNHLKETNKYVYMSELTKLLLTPKLKPSNSDILWHIKTLSLKYSTLITENDVNVSVSLLPTGHCAGAVMFLFETNSKRILYTGDIRIENEGFMKYRRLHADYDESVVKQIDTLYLDTTFLNPVYDWFPNRAESAKKICDIIQDWLIKDKNNSTFIKLSAVCGSEQLFIAIYEKLKEKIYVHKEYEDVYSKIPEMENVYTFDGNSSRIHASQKFGCCHLCRGNKILQISPTALYWTKDKFVIDKDQQLCISEVGDYSVRVCYSCHSSYSEIKYLLKYLKPKKVVACVDHKHNDFVSTFINNYNKSSNETFDSDKEDSEPLIIEPEDESLDKCSQSSDDSLLPCTPPEKYPKLS
ncbi:protein artemis [Chrysoperla carnea]|uniref:protein artemis n=1 Tax=Chrysoperla carnea TaxID=189513 RepID=UPI001D061922|nr:protein artemis [Chrysoperla carnea]